MDDKSGMGLAHMAGSRILLWARADCEAYREIPRYQAPRRENLPDNLAFGNSIASFFPYIAKLGGQDSGKDALAWKNGQRWVMAVYFPRRQQNFESIKRKFLDDLSGVEVNNASAIAIVTNQELTLGQREALKEAAGSTTVALYHLERVTAILDKPQMAEVRKQFLRIDFSDTAIRDEVESLRSEVTQAQKRLEDFQTGGETFCYWMLYHFDMATRCRGPRRPT